MSRLSELHTWLYCFVSVPSLIALQPVTDQQHPPVHCFQQLQRRDHSVLPSTKQTKKEILPGNLSISMVAQARPLPHYTPTILGATNNLTTFSTPPQDGMVHAINQSMHQPNVQRWPQSAHTALQVLHCHKHCLWCGPCCLRTSVHKPWFCTAAGASGCAHSCIVQQAAEMFHSSNTPSSCVTSKDTPP